MHHLSIVFQNCVEIDNAEDLDVVMPMYDLLEYSKNYKKTTGSLWNYYRGEPSSTIGANNITHSVLNSESSESHFYFYSHCHCHFHSHLHFHLH